MMSHLGYLEVEQAENLRSRAKQNWPNEATTLLRLYSSWAMHSKIAGTPKNASVTLATGVGRCITTMEMSTKTNQGT